MDDATLGPSPDEIMALGAMVERTLACKCRGSDQFNDEAAVNGKWKEGYGRGQIWHESNISWDDATLETTGLTDDQGLVELDLTARSMSILGEEEDDESLTGILDKFVPDKQSKKMKKSFKFLHGKSQNRIPTQETSSICATIRSVEGEEDESGFEVECHDKLHDRFEI